MIEWLVMIVLFELMIYLALRIIEFFDYYTEHNSNPDFTYVIDDEETIKKVKDTLIGEDDDD